MSSPVTSFQALGSTAPTAFSTAVTLVDAPEQLRALPAGSVLPAVLTPPETPDQTPVLTLDAPDGEQLVLQIKPAHVPSVPTPVTIKILPPEFKEAVSFRIHFSAPLPDIGEAAQTMAAPPETTHAAPVFAAVKPVAAQAFVVRSVPEQVAALIAKIDDVPLETPLPPDVPVAVELTPEQNALPVLTRPQTPDIPADLTKAPLPQKGADELVTIIEMPRGEPETPPLPAQQQQPPLSAAPTVSVPVLPPADTPVAQPAVIETPAPVTDTPAAPVPTDATPVPAQIPAAPVIAAVSAPDPAVFESAPLSDIPAKPAADTPPPLPFQPPEPAVKDAPRSPAAADGAPVLKGVVFHPDDDRPVLIATKSGALALDTAVRLPHLTPVSVKVFPPAVFDAPVLEKTPLPEFKNTWTVLTHALDTLRQTDESAFEAVKAVLPQTGGKLPALMLSYMNAAARGVSFTDFIGEANVAALVKTENGASLLKRLEREFSTSAKKATDGKNGWKGWDIPLLSGSVVEPVSLYLQRPNTDEFRRVQTDRKQAGVRFAVDINLTRLGKMQLEGLAHRQTRRFDLILRHQNALPPDFDAAVRGIFTQTLTALNYTGTVKVDKTDDFIVFAPDTDENDAVKRGVLV